MRRPSLTRLGLRPCSHLARPAAYDWCVLTEGADELELADEEVVPSDCDEPVLEEEGDELEDEAATFLLALALELPELDALRPGSWPLASVAKMTLQVAMNRATVSATAARRMRRTRARLAARRGLTLAADMGDTLVGHPKPSLSRL